MTLRLVARVLALAAIASLACAPAYAQAQAKGRAFTLVQSGTYVAPAPPPPPAPVAPTWVFSADKSLYEIMVGWSDQAGWVPHFEPAAEKVARQYRPAIGGAIQAADLKGAITQFMDGLDASVRLNVELRTANQPRLLYFTSSESP